MSLIIAIDTSEYQKYTCMISGFDKVITSEYSKIDEILSKYGHRGPLHFRKISSDVRKKSKKEMYELMQTFTSAGGVNSLNVYLYITERPRNSTRKDFYLKYVPNCLTSDIQKCFKGKEMDVDIEVDNDYTVKDVSNASSLFVETFLNQLTFKLVGTSVKVWQRPDKAYRATIKHPLSRCNIEFYGRVIDSSNSKGIQLADVVMGFYNYSKKERDNIKFSNIIRKSIIA